jgi:peroxiredoxin (alkyl hydroperoxide reductase subunit C)
MKSIRILTFLPLVFLIGCAEENSDMVPELRQVVYRPSRMKPVDSVLKVKVGQRAPDFSLPSTSGKMVSLSQYRGRKNVVLTFVPSAFTPIGSMQWPGYNLAMDMFKNHDAVLVGVTTDNVPALAAWDKVMGGLDFPILSDFWPHGKVAKEYGVLRSNGTPERAMFFIDKQGVIRGIKVFDINKRPSLDEISRALSVLK